MTAANGFIIGDGSWNLQIYVSDLQVERTLRVKGDLHIGGVMLRLVEDLGEPNLLSRHISPCFLVSRRACISKWYGCHARSLSTLLLSILGGKNYVYIGLQV
jgi:hypothetical protein